jgi:hypothetical protein
LRGEKLERDLAVYRLDSAKQHIQDIEELAKIIVESVISTVLKDEEAVVQNVDGAAVVSTPELTDELVGRPVRYSEAPSPNVSPVYKVVKVNTNRGLLTIKSVEVGPDGKPSVVTLHADDPGIVWSVDCDLAAAPSNTTSEPVIESSSISTMRPLSLADAVGYGITIRLSDNMGDEIHGLVVSVKESESMLVIVIDGDCDEEEIPFDTKELEWTGRRFAPGELPERAMAVNVESTAGRADADVDVDVDGGGVETELQTQDGGSGSSQQEHIPKSRADSHDSESYADLSSDHEDA